MTIRVSPERSTLSLPPGRLRSEEARSPVAPAIRTADRGQPASAAALGRVADSGQLRATTALLDRASSVADTASAATAALAGLMERLREGADAPQFKNFGSVVSEIVKGAAFDGVNLLDGSQADGGFRVPVAGEGGAELTLTGFDLTPGGGLITLRGDEDPDAASAELETSIANLETVRGRLGEDSKRIDAHRRFVGFLAEAVGGGAPSASLDVEGARLTALQLRQSLSGQGLSIANGAPQAVLSLFR